MQVNPDQIKKEVAEAAERMGLDYEDLAPMIPEVLEDCLVKVDTLIQVVEQGDMEQIHAVAHDLKGVCANYGLVAQSELAKAVELNREQKPLNEAKELKEHFAALAKVEF